MKFTIQKPVEVDIKYVVIDVPIDAYLELPGAPEFVKGDKWVITVDIETGCIKDWPQGIKGDAFLRVCDMGTYRLLDADMSEVLAINEDYIPNGLIPGGHGEYIGMIINSEGVIENWPNEPDISDFLNND